MEFEVVSGIPIPLAPDGTTPLASPIFSWTPVLEAFMYKLLIWSQQADEWLSFTMTKEEAGCAAGESTCSFRPDWTITAGETYWWCVAAIDGLVYPHDCSPWLQFQATGPVPLAPEGTTSLVSPTFSWTASPGANKYLVLVGTGWDVWQFEVTAAEAGCAAGEETCSTRLSESDPYVPSMKEEWTVRAGETYWWKVGTMDASGNLGDWSDLVYFEADDRLMSGPVELAPQPLPTADTYYPASGTSFFNPSLP
jgi:hypothetical protein